MTHRLRTKGNAGAIDIHIGNTLSKIRQIAGLTQENLASATGISFQQIQKYEKGINRIAVSRLYEFSKVLGVTPNDFFIGYDDFKTKNETSAEEDATGLKDLLEYPHELARSIKIFAKITNSEQRNAAAKSIVEILKLFVEK